MTPPGENWVTVDREACHGVIVPISARISPGDQPRRPVGDDEQRVGLALDAMGREAPMAERLLVVDAMGRRLPGLTHGPRSPAARRA